MMMEEVVEQLDGYGFIPETPRDVAMPFFYIQSDAYGGILWFGRRLTSCDVMISMDASRLEPLIPIW